MKASFIKAFDILIIGVVLTLVTIGILFIYSSGIDSKGNLVTNEYIKQLIWASCGLILMIFFALFDYRKFEKHIYWVYGALCIILLLLKILARSHKGASSWIGIGEFGIQPSEFGKIAFAFSLSKYLTDTERLHPLLRLAGATGLLALPAGLILIQPDTGTASTYVAIYFLMLFFSDIPLRFTLFIFGIATSTIFFTILPIWNQFIKDNSYYIINALTIPTLKILIIGTAITICLFCLIVRRYFKGPKYFYWLSYGFAIISAGLILSTPVLKVLEKNVYQEKRIVSFLDPTKDPQGAAYHLNQSLIAIGSGGFRGQSYLHGTQSHLRFLPEQSTDFIFSVLSEESGFLGCLVIFVLYFLFLSKNISIIQNTSNKFGYYIAAGFLGMYSIHFFVNVGMVMGKMPITGLPLMFISYGGSSLITAMASAGILMGIQYRKYNFS